MKWMFLVITGLFSLTFFSDTFAFLFFSPTYDITAQKALSLKKSDFSGNIDTINEQVLKDALKAYSCARKRGLDSKEVLTVIDYSKPAVEPRLWVIDLKHLHVKYNELVAHGEHSGDMTATKFSNTEGTHESSIGTFLTANKYYGHNGIAVRLKGLEPGFNDNAMHRAIVIHGANYVSAQRVVTEGRIGRSFGCPAIPKGDAKKTVNAIKNGTLVFAYGNDNYWLKHSSYLHC